MVAHRADLAPARLPKRAKLTVELPAALVERLRDVAFWLSGPPQQLTLARITERALFREIQRLEEEHNEGRPFETRTRPLKVGRPISR